MKYLIPTLVVIMFACSPQRPAQDDSTLGDLKHEFSISPEAKPFFEKGLLLLHSFEYEDAREEFERARAIDPDEVMVYWGLAMTHYKALWGLQNLKAGRIVISQLGESEDERYGKAENQLEKDFWKGVEILYGDGELKDRNQEYVDHMSKVYDKNPANLEVAAFYSLGLMWADYDNQEYLTRSSEVAAGIIKENPTHPGGLHYMIHANDDPQFAQAAINAADEYAKVAPDATHALHMPSHIYVALGMWNEVVSSNEASYEASLKRVARKGLSGKDRGYHSMAWLHYGLLQLGKYDQATELLAEMISYHQDGTSSRSYLAMMQNQQRIEAGYWPENLELQDVDVSDLGLEEKAHLYFSRSLIAFDQKNITAIQNEVKELTDDVESAKLLVTDDGIALCSAGPTRYAPNEESLRKAKVVIQQMQALAALVMENKVLVEEHLKSAVDLESKSNYDPGPPFIAYPAFEQYGDWLLTQNRPEDALVQFQKSLDNRTNRTKALRGKLTALKSLDKLEEAEKVEELLAKLSPDLIASN